MKFAIISILFLWGIGLNAQDNQMPIVHYQQLLCSGDILKVGENAVKFKEVVSDSRCPKNVECIWAGEVKVLLEFYIKGNSIGEQIVTGINFPLKDFFGKAFSLIGFEVYPYPENPGEIKASEYSLQLYIDEKIEE